MKQQTLFTIAKSLLLFLAIIFIGDRSLGYLLDKLYDGQKRGDFYQTTYAVKQTHEQVLIFGSSRAMHHYVSNIFEKELGLSTYNIGRNGKNILYSYALFKQILTYHRPDIVIIDVQPSEFNWKAGEDGEDEMIFSLLPYIDQPSIYESISNIRKKDIFLSKLFKTYPYNSNIAQLLGYYWGFMPGIKNDKGYVALKGSKIKSIAYDEDKKEAKQQEAVADPVLKKTFKDFLSLARKNGIDVYVIVSPTIQQTNDNSIASMQKISQQSGFKFYDFSHLDEFKSSKLFYDNSHLNNKGAIKFSELVAWQLKQVQPNVAKSHVFIRSVSY